MHDKAELQWTILLQKRLFSEPYLEQKQNIIEIENFGKFKSVPPCETR